MVMRRLHSFSEKDKVLTKNIVAAFAIKGGALFVSLFTMPAYMRFFSDQQILGVWFTVLSVLSWILNFDLGIGNGLRNKMAASLAIGDMDEAKKLNASAYWMLGAAVFVISVIGNAMATSINWNVVFNISEELIPQESFSIIVRQVFLGIMLQFFLRLISSILYAMQKSAINNLVALITSLLQLGFILLAPSASPIENLKLLSSAYIVISNLPLILVTIVVFIGPLRSCRPHPKYFQIDKAKSILSLGGIFFACQILYMIIANTNEFFISQYTSPDNVVEYQIYNRLFSLGSMIFMLALTPVWSMVSKAAAEEDYEWLKKVNRNLTILSVLGTIVEFTLVLFLQFIVNFWLKEKAIEINYVYALSFALFGSVMIFQSTISVITNGMGRMKTQAISYAIGVIAKFIIIHYGIALTGSWIVVVLANALILIPYCIVQQLDLQKYLNRHIVSHSINIMD